MEGNVGPFVSTSTFSLSQSIWHQFLQLILHWMIVNVGENCQYKGNS